MFESKEEKNNQAYKAGYDSGKSGERTYIDEYIDRQIVPHLMFSEEKEQHEIYLKGVDKGTEDRKNEK